MSRFEVLLDRLVTLLLRLLLAEKLGHGRRMEGYLVLCKLLGAIVYFSAPKDALRSVATADLVWLGVGGYLFLPFLLAFSLSCYGLVANLNAWRCSRVARFLGAAIGLWIWSFLSVKLWQGSAIATEGFVLGVPAIFYGELGTMFYAAANKPTPGALGNLR